jgi:DNA-binding response OmpR family regulator
MANDARQSVIQIGDFTLDTITNCINKDNETIPLTRLECKILQLLYINAGMPLSREDLMWQTMGIRYVPSNRSIDTHVNRLRKKIEKVPADPLYIRTVRGRGYCFHLPRT